MYTIFMLKKIYLDYPCNIGIWKSDARVPHANKVLGAFGILMRMNSAPENYRAGRTHFLSISHLP